MKQPAKQKAFSTCTLKELCPDDKQKVAKLVKQVVELGQENQRLKDALEKASVSAEEKLKQIQDCNKQAVCENCSLKTKLGQAVTVLRMYHHKVQGLDAALRAMQNAATYNGPQQDGQDRQQQQKVAEPVICDSGRGQQAAVTGSNIVQQTVPQTATSSSCVDTSHQHSRTSSPAGSAAAAAARLQQQAQQLSELMSQQKFFSDSAPEIAAAATPQAVAVSVMTTPVSSCGSTAAMPTAVLEQLPPASRAAATAVPARPAAAAGPSKGASASADDAEEKALPFTPLVLPPQCSVGAREALRDLAHWQLQQGLITPGQVDQTIRKVLQFDPSVGSHGAFIIRDLPELASAAADTGSAAHAAAGGGHSGRCLQPALGTLPPSLPVIPLPLLGHACDAIPCTHGIARLSDASPWVNRADKQLLNLAAAFDSLAALSPASAAARSSNVAADDDFSAAAAANVGDGSTSRMLPFDTGSTATANSFPAAAAPSGVSNSCSILSVKAGPAAAQSVEEVAVEAVDAWRVPVVVQNEKSWSSLHGHASPLMMEHTQQQQCQQATGSMAVAQQHLPVQQRQYQQAYDTAQSQVRWQYQQAAMQQHPQYSRVQQHSTIRTQQQTADLQQQGSHPVPALEAHQTADQQPQYLPPQQQQQPSRDWNGQRLEEPMPCWQQPPLTLTEPYYHQQQVVCSCAQPAGPDTQAGWYQHDWSDGQQQQCSAESNSGYSNEREMSKRCSMQQCSTSPVNLPDTADTRKVLERFDESLVDLLMEVERLEQQQQVCKQELQQQQQLNSRRPLQQLPQQQWSSTPLQTNCQQQWQQQRCSQPTVKQNCKAALQNCKLPRQQMQRKGQHMQQQRHRGVRLNPYEQDAEEDDVVSDILNHLD